MKVTNKIKRAKGSTVILDGVAYTFNDANGHSCDVQKAEHIAVFKANPSFEIGPTTTTTPASAGPVESSEPAVQRPRKARIKRAR